MSTVNILLIEPCLSFFLVALRVPLLELLIVRRKCRLLESPFETLGLNVKYKERGVEAVR